MMSCFSALSAKELTFYLGNEKVANGATVEFKGYEEWPAGSQTEVYIEPKVYLVSDVAGDVTVKSTSNYEVQLCIGGQCEASTSVVKEGLSFEANAKNDLLLECSVFFGKDEEIVLPKIDVVLEAWYDSDPSTVYTMNLKLGDTSGIKDAINGKNAVKVVGKTLSYDFEGSNTISIYNLAGTAVGAYKVSGAGSISLDSLSTGVYLYRTGDSKAGKIIIR